MRGHEEIIKVRRQGFAPRIFWADHKPEFSGYWRSVLAESLRFREGLMFLLTDFQEPLAKLDLRLLVGLEIYCDTDGEHDRAEMIRAKAMQAQAGRITICAGRMVGKRQECASVITQSRGQEATCQQF